MKRILIIISESTTPTLSWISSMWICMYHLHHLRDASIGHITISDHAPVSLTLSLSDLGAGDPCLNLNLS